MFFSPRLKPGYARRQLTEQRHVDANRAAYPEAGEDASLDEDVRWYRGCLGSPDLD